MDLANSHIVITGGTSGIGKATAFTLAERGANLLLLGRRRRALKSVCKEIKHAHPESKICVAGKCDVRNEKEVQKTIETFAKTYGKIDVLINNAGILDYGKLHKQQPKKWLDVIHTNLYGTFLCTKFTLPYMIKRKQGHIINISSVYGKQASPDSSAYCASKYGVRGLSESLRQEVGKYNIKVSVVHPSTTSTNIFKGTPFRPDQKKTLAPEDIARAILSILTTSAIAVVSEIDVVPLKDPYA